jgi:hypothetical protein
MQSFCLAKVVVWRKCAHNKMIEKVIKKRKAPEGEAFWQKETDWTVCLRKRGIGMPIGQKREQGR